MISSGQKCLVGPAATAVCSQSCATLPLLLFFPVPPLVLCMLPVMHVTHCSSELEACISMSLFILDYQLPYCRQPATVPSTWWSYGPLAFMCDAELPSVSRDNTVLCGLNQSDRIAVNCLSLPEMSTSALGCLLWHQPQHHDSHKKASQETALHGTSLAGSRQARPGVSARGCVSSVHCQTHLCMIIMRIWELLRAIGSCEGMH